MAYQKASRQGTKALIGLIGHSGTGKTRSALRLARGLIGVSGKIGFLDTETGRSRVHSDVTEFYADDLEPPFSPARYLEKLRDAEKNKFDAFIIDSGSHEWEGEGGVLEMAESGTTQYAKPLQGLAKWNKPKAEHKKLVNAILQSRMHIIICMRGKDKLVQAKDDKGKDIIVHAGVEPIQDARFKYEMTIGLILNQDHTPSIYKCPDELLPLFPSGKMITEETGRGIAEWIDGAAPIDHALELLKRNARDNALNGATQLKTWFEALPTESKRLIKPSMDAEYKQLAEKADKAAGEATQGETKQQENV